MVSKWLGFLCFMLFFLTVVFVAMLLSTDVVVVINIVFVVLVGGWLFSHYLYDKIFFVLSLYVVLGLFSAVLISFFLESGVYLTEIKQVSFSSGLPAKSAIQCFLFLFGVSLTVRYLMHDRWHIIDVSGGFLMLCRWGGVSVIAFMILILLYIRIQYGSPNSIGVHRMNYWASHAPSWGNTVVYALIQMCLPLGFFFKEYKKKFELLVFFTILVTIMMMGVRFTGIVVSLILFVTPLLIVKPALLRIFKAKQLFISLALFSIVVIGVFLGFENYDSQSRVDRLITRASLQPQTWWALDQLSDWQPKKVDDIVSHYLGIGSAPYDQGMYYLMYKIAPADIVNQHYETGSSFALGGIFNNVYFFGYYLGGVINFLLGLVFGGALGLLGVALRSNNILAILLTFRLSYKLQAIMVSGTIPNLFSLELLLLFVFSLFFIRYKSLVR